MKKSSTLLAGLLFLLFSARVHAQYAIMPMAPPPAFTFNDLWQFTVTRAGADNQSQFYVSLRMYNETGQLKVKSNTATLQLPAGSHYYNLANIADLQPFSTSYYDASLLQQAVSSGGTFPPGVYNLVYTLYGREADGEFVSLAEGTAETVVEAMWPPMLLSPPDGDTIDSPIPLLIWTPAFSSSYTGPITYTLNLVEQLAGQNSYQAIQSNPAYFSQSGIPVTTLLYPSGAQVLDTGKTYAWQVHADANGTSMGSSEIWRFTLATPKPAVETPDSLPLFYIELEPAYPQTFITTSQKRIPFKFNNRYNQDSDSLNTFALYRDGEQQSILSSQTCDSCLFLSQKVYYILHLEDNGDFTPGFYLLKVFDSKNNVQFLRILYTDEE